MRIMNKNRHAYTLAEVMTVLLVVTIIFAAFAPLFTGRIRKNYRSKYNVWSWANFVVFDAFATPNTNPNETNELVFGATPNDKAEISTVFSPLSKVIIRSGDVTQNSVTQRQMQFRYGRTKVADDSGKFAGTWLVDGSNYLIGGRYHKIKESDTNIGRNNTAIGYDALTSLKEANNNTAIGFMALATVSKSDSKASKCDNNVAIGYQAGYSTIYDSAGTEDNPRHAGRNTFIGAGAGAKATTGYGNIAIGYNAMGNDIGTGYNNSFIGASSGYSATSGKNNVAVGYNALYSLTTGSNNVAIGYNAGYGITSGSNNIAIGYNACSEVTTGSNKTCIGYNSGPHQYNRNAFKSTDSWTLRNSSELTNSNNKYKYTSTADFLKGGKDDAVRTYIGSRPYNFGGDAVLEIHNISAGNKRIPGADTSQFNTTTVINGNLIVRGRPYFTVGNKLHHFYDYDTSKTMQISGDSNATSFYYYGYSQNYSPLHKVCSDNSIGYNFDSNCISLKTKTTSDRRLKNIDGKFTYGLDKLRKINIYNYTFKEDKNKLPHVGVIAQDLQKVFPTAVFKGEDGYLRIRWDEMFYAMINGIKEIDKRIISLVNRTNKVETQISQLEKENLHLKKQVENLTVRINKIKAQ